MPTIEHIWSADIDDLPLQHINPAKAATPVRISIEVQKPPNVTALNGSQFVPDETGHWGRDFVVVLLAEG